MFTGSKVKLFVSQATKTPISSFPVFLALYLIHGFNQDNGSIV